MILPLILAGFPDEHAAWLTRKSAPNNIAATMQWIGVLAPIEGEIVECFRAL